MREKEREMNKTEIATVESACKECEEERKGKSTSLEESSDFLKNQSIKYTSLSTCTVLRYLTIIPLSQGFCGTHLTLEFGSSAIFGSDAGPYVGTTT